MKRAAPIVAALALLAAPAFAGMLEDSLDKADAWWARTQELAGSALERTRRLWREERPEYAHLWENLLPRLDEVLQLRDRQRELPESSWFGEDKASAGQAIDELLDEAAVILVGDNRYRRQARELAQAMAGNRQAIADLKRRRLTAPSASPWRTTVEEIDAEIAAREAMIAEQEAELARIRTAFAAELERMGLEMDAGKLDFLLSTVVGDEVVDMSIAFERIRALSEQLEALTAESREDLPTARRYYGMYLVLLKILDRMHAQLIDAIAHRYLPLIDAIGNRARRLMRETRRLQAQGPNPILEGNLKAQQLTIEAAARYGDYLRSQRQQIIASRERLGRDLAVADNTYETVKVSGDLVALMKDSRRLLDTLFTLQVPRLRAFENLEMKREFKRLTLRLRTAAAP